MIEFELEKPYKTQEVAEIMGVTYDTFRHSRKKYEERLSSGYKWEYVKRKYIFHEKIGNVYEKKSEEMYNEIYLPLVVEIVNRNPWNTGSGITNELWTEEVMNQVQHVMSTAYTYVCDVLGNEYNITGKKYAACKGKGIYPRFMTDEEINEWKNLRGTCVKNNSEKIGELTEMWATGLIKTAEYNKKIKALTSGSYLEALGHWMEEKGYIPVMLNHYERKPEIEMKNFDWE